MSPRQELIDKARKLAVELDENGEDFRFISRTLESVCSYLAERERERLDTA